MYVCMLVTIHVRLHERDTISKPQIVSVQKTCCCSNCIDTIVFLRGHIEGGHLAEDQVLVAGYTGFSRGTSIVRMCITPFLVTSAQPMRPGIGC